MTTLVSGIDNLAVAVRNKINLMVPRLLPGGGAVGQVLAKTTLNNYQADWIDLGSAALYSVGTSGHAIPLLDASNSWSVQQLFENGLLVGGGDLTARLGTDSQTGKTFLRAETQDGFTTKPLEISGSTITLSSDTLVSGLLTAGNLSGVNTGDQTIVLTGDVSGTGTGTFSTTLTSANLRSLAALAYPGGTQYLAFTAANTISLIDAASTLPAFTGDVSSQAGSAELTLATVNANTGNFGSAMAVPVLTVNAKGLVTGLSTSPLGSAAVRNIGTSGDTVPLLNGANSWSSPQNFFRVLTSAPSVSGAGLNLPHGNSPTSPLDGDLWTSSTAFWLRLNGNSKQLAFTDSSITGSAAYLTTARTIAATGDILWNVAFNGNSNVSSVATLATVNANTGTFGSSSAVPVLTLDTKGRITSASSAALGSAAIADTGTSGHVLGFLDTTNMWSGQQTFARLLAAASTAANASLNIALGTAPSTPLAGDLWLTPGGLYVRSDMATKTVAYTDSSITGSAATLTTPRSISATGDISWTTSFDGSSNSTGSATLTTVNANTGSFGSSSQIPVLSLDAKGRVISASSVPVGDATTAATLKTARSISTTGDVSWTTSFDGSGDATGTASLATVNVNTGTVGSSAAVPILTLDAKGRVTAASTAPLGTAATYDIGTSGGTIPLLNTINTWSANQTFTGAISASNFSGSSSGTNTGDQTTITGNAGSATRLQTSRTIASTGDLSWSVSFDGTANVASSATLASVNTNTGSWGSASAVPILTVNAKGLVTAISTASLGTAATHNTGTSGSTVPLLDGDNTWSGDQSFNNITIAGNLNVAGTTTTVNSTNLNVSDSIISLASNNTTASSPHIGLRFVRSTGTDDAYMVWKESVNGVVFYNSSPDETFTSGTTKGNIYGKRFFADMGFTSLVATGTAPLTISSTTLVANLNADLLDGQEGTYYSNAANLTGTISAARLPVVNATTGSFGSASSVPTITVNDKGLVTAVSSNPLGTSVSYDIGTSGAKVPLLDGTNTWSGKQTLAGSLLSKSTGLVRIEDTGANAVAGSQGLGLELYQSGGATYIQSYNRTSNTFAPLYVYATDTTYSGTLSASNLSGTNSGDQTTITGNAGTATRLQTARTIKATGDVLWTVTFDGSAAVSSAAALATVNSNTGTFGSSAAVPVLTVNAKGLVTAVSTAALGTAAVRDTGTSGTTIPLLDGVNTWSGDQAFGNVSVSGTLKRAGSTVYDASNLTFGTGLVLSSGVVSLAPTPPSFLSRFAVSSGATSFTMAQSAASVNDIIVTQNGQRLDPTADYTVSGTSLTVSGAQNGDIIIAERNGGSTGPTIKSIRGFSKGKPLANEILLADVLPYGMSLSSSRSVVKSLTSATASYTLVINRDSTQIGSIAFAAGSSSATVSFTDTAVSEGQMISISAPSGTDTTLANIVFRLME